MLKLCSKAGCLVNLTPQLERQQPMFNPQTGMFDATMTQPEQGIPAHPVGKFPAQISLTEVKANNAGDGHYLAIEFSTPAGKIVSRYNFWNKEPRAVEIAGKQFSALCWATGVFNTNINNGAPELRGAACQIEVTKQANNDYTQVSHVYTRDGAEPGRQAAQPMQQQAPMQPMQQPQQQWPQPQPQQQPQQPAPMQQQPGGGWPQPNQQPAPGPQQPPQPGPGPQPQPQVWQPGPAQPAAQPNWAQPQPGPGASQPSGAQVWTGPR